MSSTNPGTDPGAHKPVTRQAALASRDGLAAAVRDHASARIAEHATALLADRMTVALYAPKGSEVDTLALDDNLRARGCRVVYPRTQDSSRVLEFHEITPERLVTARFGIKEPRLDWRNQVGLVEIDAFVVPGLAFDAAGGRLGYGRGYYDATLGLAAAGALRVGLAFDIQIVADAHREAHDIPLHVVVTETTSYRTPS